MTYPIERLPPKAKPAPLNTRKVRESMKGLARCEGFVIPAAELTDSRGRYSTLGVNTRVHMIARRLGIKVSTKKIPEGLRVRREK